MTYRAHIFEGLRRSHYNATEIDIILTYCEIDPLVKAAAGGSIDNHFPIHGDSLQQAWSLSKQVARLAVAGPFCTQLSN